MYAWIWRHLPGGGLGKSLSALTLAVAVLALLFFVVFPWVEPRLPFEHVTVHDGGSVESPAPARG